MLSKTYTCTPSQDQDKFVHRYKITFRAKRDVKEFFTGLKYAPAVHLPNFQLYLPFYYKIKIHHSLYRFKHLFSFLLPNYI